jgi:hypothetical protein
MKSMLVLFLVLAGVSNLFAQQAASPLSLSVGGTYGLYSESQQRDKIISESVSISYTPILSAGLSLALKHSTLTRKPPLDEIGGISTDLSYYEFLTLTRGDYLGSKLGLHYISSDDLNSDGTIIPYLSVSFKPANLLSAFELGYTRTPYNDTTAEQVTLMGATSLFDQWVWLQTKAYYIILPNDIQGKQYTLAVEERLSYYVVPSKLTLSLYALLGERIYAYDIDLGTAYNLSDIQKGSLGLSLNYNLKDKINIFTDFTHEQYFNTTIGDGYLVRYFTIGASAKF